MLGDKEEPGDTGYHSALMCDIENVPSPATSTPSSTPSPNRSREDNFRVSELQDTDVSVIDSSVADTEKPESKRESKSATLTGKSVVEGAQDTSDLSRDDAPKSNVAQRTRSKIGEKRRKETSELLENRDTSICSTMAESGASMSSFTTNEENTWVNELVYKSFNELNDTMDLVDEAIMKGNDGREVVKEIREYMAESEIIDLVDDDQEAPKKRKKVTFSKEYGKCNEIIDEVLRFYTNHYRD